MGLENVPRCQHVKVNGVQCGSPALRRKRHCYFHERVQYERELAVEDKSGLRKFGFPLLEDANSIQVALMKVIQLLGSGCLDPKTAGLMLYALQTASANLRHAKFEPEKATDVVIDEDTVDLTRLSGMQWCARDFKEKEEEKVQGTEEAKMEGKEKEKMEGKEKDPKPAERAEPGAPAATSSANRAVANPNPCANKTALTAIPDKNLQDIARRRELKRNLPESSEDDEEPSSLARVLLDRMIPGWEEDEKAEKAEKARNAAAAAQPRHVS